jgi:transposase-like protein
MTEPHIYAELAGVFESVLNRKNVDFSPDLLIKQRLRPMLGLKSFRTAAVIIGGIELAEKIKKQQFKLGILGGSKATMPELWQAALAA